jgi:membrane protease subunit (stomatin/prohibitin family)
MSQFIEVINWADETGRTMVYRFPAADRDIKVGAQLIVMQNQSAVFFRDGKALDVFKPGRHTLTSLNLPVITKLMSLPFGFKTPFKADVYFLNMRVFTEMKWGTKEAIPFRDKEFKMIRLRAFGNFSIRITDPLLFINTIVGSRSLYTTESIEDFLRGVIANRLNDVLGESLETILDLTQHYDEISAGLKARVKDDYDKYGLDLVDFLIDAITPPDEVQKMIDERAGMEAVGNMGAFAQFQAAKAMRDIGKGIAEGGGGGSGASQGAGLGAGIGMGMMLPQMMMQQMWMNQMQTGPNNQGQMKVLQCTGCGSFNFQGAKFCSNCGAKMEGEPSKPKPKGKK